MRNVLRSACGHAAALAFLLPAIGAGASYAASLAPGGSVAADTGTLASLGTKIADTGVQPYSALLAGTGIVGTAEAYVYKEAGGTLDFVYDFTVSASSPSPVESATASQFGSFGITDVGYIPGAGVIPNGSNVTRTADGNVVKFFFPLVTGVPAGTAADTFFIRTNATSFVPGAYSLQDGQAANLNGYQPASAVPLPTTLNASLGILGCFGLFQAARRMRAKTA